MAANLRDRRHATFRSVAGFEGLQLVGGGLPIVERFLQRRLYFLEFIGHFDGGHAVVRVEGGHLLVERLFLVLEFGDLLFEFADAVLQFADGLLVGKGEGGLECEIKSFPRRWSAKNMVLRGSRRRG